MAAAVSWTCALIDAHFTSFAVRGKKVGSEGEGEGEEGEALEAMASLRKSADRLRAACESVGIDPDEADARVMREEGE